MKLVWWCFLFSSRRRHTRCALVTGVQTCALPILVGVLIVDRRELHLRPGRLGHFQPVAVGLEAPRQQPVRLALLGRDEADGVFAQALGRRLRLDVGDEAVLVLIEGTDLLDGRSEEHTSELQSLMRISYAVFCLKKKNMTQQLL